MTNKPNIEVPNHTDRIDEIVNNGFNQIYIRALRDAHIDSGHVHMAKSNIKAQLRDYIADEIKIIIGENEYNSQAYPFVITEAQDKKINRECTRDRLRIDQLNIARKRGHNV